MRAIIALALASFLTAPALAQEDYEPGETRWSFAIHGGAGTIERANMTPEQEAEYRAALDAALEHLSLLDVIQAAARWTR